MKLARAFVIGVAVLLIASCARDSRRRANETLQRVGGEQLRRDAALLYKTVFARHGLDFVVLPAKVWPASFQQFSPVRVGAYPDGISLALASTNGRESGLYIVPATMEHRPSATHGGTFERLADGVYWYSFGD